MQITSIRNTNFGLTTSKEVQKLLANSAKKIKGDDGKKWIATKREMKNALSDKHELIIEEVSSWSPEQKLIVKSPNGNRWVVGFLANQRELLSLEKLKNLVSELIAVNREEHDNSSDNDTILSEF